MTPLAVAHRGDPVAHRENTLAAFGAAVEAGADMVELDVHVTADGAAAVIHDPTLDRLWNVPRHVAEMTMDELRALGIPDLAAALAAVPVQVMVDYTDGAVVAPALEAVEAAGALERVVFSGDNYDGHRQIRAQHADARIALTWTRRRGRPDALLDELGAEFFNPSGKVLAREPGLVAAMHARGTAVSVWTIDRREDMELLLDLGVDAVITNRIGTLVELIAERRPVEEAC